LIAFLLILGAAFYAVATSLMNLVSDSLFQTRIGAETATANELAERFAPLFARADTDALYSEAVQAGRELGGRLLLLDTDGKVQVDTFSQYNGLRLGHPEIVSVLNGAVNGYGFHQLAGSAGDARRALFDFLRDPAEEGLWAGYFTAPLAAEGARVGVLLYSTDVQDLHANLRVIQDQMLLYFLTAAVAVLVLSLVFSRVITRPIEALSVGIRRMAAGDLSGRVPVKGGDEMGRLAEAFNQMTEKLENLDTSRNEFVSNASHELKTPLATMKILLESMLYEENMDPMMRKEFMTDINKELDRLSTIVTDLLTLVRSDAGDYQLKRERVPLRPLINDTLARLKPLAEQREQRLELRAPGDVIVDGDPSKLQQVVYNLVENAIKYSPVKGQVRVTLQQPGRMAVLEVSDNGPGIPKKDQPHIFDRFYRVDRARARATGGNGLGLSIVHQAVLLHGGSISVQSEEGKGATFRVELPI
jgi:signal transduction histidine kinase